MDKRVKDELAQEFGGKWCDCIHKVIGELSAAKLAVYCESRYKRAHPIITDECGIRYGYKLTTVTSKVTVNQDEVEKTYNFVAFFGEFTLREFDTLQSVLQAIDRIADFEKRSAQSVAEDVAKCDPQQAPAPGAEPRADDRVFIPGTKRQLMTSEGMRTL